MLQDVEALGVRGHDPVLDAVVDHLHEVAGAVRAAVQVARSRRSPGRRCGPGVRGAASTPGRDRGEDRVEVRDDVVLAADHQAEAALEAEHAAARADVDVVDALSA